MDHCDRNQLLCLLVLVLLELEILIGTARPLTYVDQNSETSDIDQNSETSDVDQNGETSDIDQNSETIDVDQKQQ